MGVAIFLRRVYGATRRTVAPYAQSARLGWKGHRRRQSRRKEQGQTRVMREREDDSRLHRVHDSPSHYNCLMAFTKLPICAHGGLAGSSAAWCSTVWRRVHNRVSHRAKGVVKVLYIAANV